MCDSCVLLSLPHIPNVAEAGLYIYLSAVFSGAFATMFSGAFAAVFSDGFAAVCSESFASVSYDAFAVV